MRNLDITTLRSFLAVAQSGGVTRASGFLNLTQSAVSMQLKRLEEMLDLQLLDRSGRGVSLTASGEQLLGYARRMVDLNDEIYARLTDQAFEGEVLLGVPHDIVYPVIPQVLQRMGAAYPRVRVQLVSSYTSSLLEQYRRGEIDVILTTEGGLRTGGETLAEVPLRWIGAPGGIAWKQRPLRLAYCRYCTFRNGALRRLDELSIAWEMAVDSESDRTIEATVSADLAITSMLEGHAPPHLVHIDPVGSLPDLGIININLYGSTARREVVEELKTMIRQGFSVL
ncbi:LysR family transcriptional regulator [Puniceibacterium sp. IMCC21224]|uniref:LysR family transcriptional regulator n=1 Tax=Puniceibacterium sp. IMCC21224 TaxID=1618204 RepID=UPI00064DBB4C|nr:LysR family transcriptional regulator [Puniceibacterium sp. IMCC21224]KMK67839.1 transcriptional regulator [Puniceibacterium sp. IMCC21224]